MRLKGSMRALQPDADRYALRSFFTDHDHCGELDAGVDGPVVWMACDCGASRRVDEQATAG